MKPALAGPPVIQPVLKNESMKRTVTMTVKRSVTTVYLAEVSVEIDDETAEAMIDDPSDETYGYAALDALEYGGAVDELPWAASDSEGDETLDIIGSTVEIEPPLGRTK
jgi:hypothetical protein